MATTPIIGLFAGSNDLDFFLYADGSDVLVDTIAAVSPEANRTTMWVAEYTGTATGLHYVVAKVWSGHATQAGNVIGSGWVNLHDTTDRHYFEPSPMLALMTTLVGGGWQFTTAALAPVISRISGTTVTIASTAITAGATLPIIRNQAYDGIAADKISITVEHTQDLTAGGTTATLKIQDGDTYVDELAISADTITDMGGDDYQMTFPLTAAQTQSLIDGGNYTYTPLIVVNGTSNLYPISGTVTVRRYD